MGSGIPTKYARHKTNESGFLYYEASFHDCIRRDFESGYFSLFLFGDKKHGLCGHYDLMKRIYAILNIQYIKCAKKNLMLG